MSIRRFSQQFSESGVPLTMPLRKPSPVRGKPRHTALALMLSLAAPAVVVCAADAPSRLPSATPESVGMDGARLAVIEEIVSEGIDDGEMPGAVVLVGRRGRVVYFEAFGRRRVEPVPEPMTRDTLFDLASLTKPVAAATSVMKLVEAGLVDLDAPVSRYIPEFAANGKHEVTVRQLLTHQGGLIADNPLSDYDDGPQQSLERVFALSLRTAPGTRFIYSDVGYIVLGEVVERVSGEELDEFSRRTVFEPLGMQETGFLPREPLRKRAAPTEQRGGEWMQGEVHDPRAYRLGGVAGHAGLFSTADDLAVYAQTLLNGGEYEGVRILDPETVTLMTQPQSVPGGGRRALGWDVRTGYSSNRGDLLSERAYGHGGFTGVVLWIDPELELFYIFLSNRLHPDGEGAVNRLAGRIGTVAAAAVCEEGEG